MISKGIVPSRVRNVWSSLAAMFRYCFGMEIMRCGRRTRDRAMAAWRPAGPPPMMIASYMVMMMKSEFVVGADIRTVLCGACADGEIACEFWIYWLLRKA